MLCVAILALTLLLGPNAYAAPPVTAFVGVDVIPMTAEKVLRDQTVLVASDRIIAVGARSRTRIPRGAITIEGHGKYLIPGLAEMHGHVPPPQAPQQATSDVLFLYLSNGVTTVRGMLGAPGQLDLRERVRRGEIDSPTLYLAGPSFNGNSVDSPQQAASKVREQKKEGWDLLKVHPGLTRAEYDAMAATANEAGIRFGGHVPSDVGLARAIEAGQETFDHIDGYMEHLNGYDGPIDQERLQSIVRDTKAGGAWIVPTSALWEVLFNAIPLDELRAYDELRYVSPQQVEQWSTAYRNRAAAPDYDAAVSRRVVTNRTEILRALHRGGVRILMGTDAPQQFSVPGFSLHRELKRMSAAGMTPYDILVSGTRNVGEYFQKSDSFGTIEKGKRADLVLLTADPMKSVDNLAQIAGVMARGKWYSRRTIDDRLRKIDATN